MALIVAAIASGASAPSGARAATSIDCQQNAGGGARCSSTPQTSPGNHAPLARDMAISVREDLAKRIGLRVSDRDGDRLTLSIVRGPRHGRLSGRGTNRTYIPNPNFNGRDSFTFRARDGRAGSRLATASVSVRPVNDRPSARNGTAEMDEDAAPTEIDFGPLVFDRETPDDRLRYEILSGPSAAQGLLSGSGPKRSFDSAAGFHGAFDILYRVHDRGDPTGCGVLRTGCAGPQTSETRSVSVSVASVNQAPVVNLTGGPTGPVDEGPAEHSYAFTVSDADGGGDFTPKSGFPDCGTGGELVSGSLETTASGGSFKCRFPDGPASPTVRVQVSDGADDSNVASQGPVEVRNVRPTAGLSGPALVEESTSDERTYDFTVEDPGDDSYSVSSGFPDCGAGNSLVSGSVTENPDGGSFKCIFPDGPADSEVKVRVEDSDGAADTDDQKVDVTVDNAAPTATFSAPSSVQEGQAIDLALNAADPAGTNDTLEYRFKCGADPFTAYGSSSTASCPTSDEGSVAVKGQVRDSDEAESAEYSDTVTVDNAAPVLTAPADQQGEEGVSKSFDLGSFSDAGADGPWEVTVDWGDGSTDDTFSAASAGSLGQRSHTYTSDGPRTVTVTVAEAGGTPEGSTTFDVSVPNEPPEADAQAATTEEDTPRTLTLSGSDPGGDPLTYEVTSLPSHGRLFEGTGTGGDEIVAADLPHALSGDKVTYAPDRDYHGPDDFDFRADDGSAKSADATVSLTVNPADDPAVAADDSDTVAEDANATAVDVLANDTDADGDPRTITSASDPAHGTVVLTGGSPGAHTGLTYQPDPNYCDDPGAAPEDTFTYTLNGGSQATVSMKVTCVNDLPAAGDQSVSVDEDDDIDITLAGSDADGDSLTYSIVGAPAHGTLSGSGANRTYTPDSNYNGPDSFTYKANDGTSDSNVGTVSVTVNPVDDPPVAVDDSETVLEDAAAAAVPVLSNDTDIDGGPKTITSASDPANGTVVLTGGSPGAHTGLTYQPDPNYCNDPPATTPDTFTYTLSGGSTATVSMTVTCVNDAPQADDETFTGASGAIGNTSLAVDDPSDGAPSASGPQKKVSGDILDGDTDVDGPGPLTVTPGTFATNDGGSVRIEADGDFVYLGDPADLCADTSDFFDYTVEDSGSPEQTDTGRVNVSIAGCVWYVNNNSAGNSGTSSAPFDTLAQAEAASGANHTVFVYDGDNTSAGYGAGFAMNAGERLIGEHEGLVVDPDGGGTLGPETLLAPSPGARPTVTDTNADVVELDDASEVRGFNLDPQGTGGGIAGSSGDTGGSTIDDVNIADNGTAGTQPGLELDGTTGTFNLSDLTVSTNGATGVRLNNAGTVNFAPTGTISITSAGAKGLDATNTNMGSGSVFDDIRVTGSGTGGVSMSGTTGTTTFGDGTGTDLDLTTTSGSTPAFGISNGGAVSVPSGGTANVSATGGPAVDVAGTAGASLPFDDVDSTNSASDGINLDGLGTGSFSASSGDIAGAAGIAFDLNGGGGDVTYPGNLGNGQGSTAEVTGRSGGTVTLSGSIAESGDADTTQENGGIAVSGNPGGSTVVSNAAKGLNTGEDHAIVMDASDGHTLTLSGGGLDIDTTSGKGLEAATSGTLNVTGTLNTIDTTTGRALNATDTDVGGTPLTLHRISSNGASSGIQLSNTGTNNALTVSSTGSGTCTSADQTGCSGGRIRNTVGADNSGATPSGTGIVLNNTRGVSLTRMHIQDHQNYGIRGTSVVGFTLADSVINGTNGTNSSTPFNEGSVRFSELTGTVSVTDTPISGGSADNVVIDNTTGTLNSTFSSVNIGANSVSDGNDGIQVEGTGSATVNVTVQNSTFTSSRGDLFQWIGNGTGGGALTFTGNTLSNNHPGIATGGGGVTVSGGGPGNATMNISNNTSRDSHTAAFTILKSPPFANGPCPAVPTSLTTTVNNNTIGVAGVANSGSLEGSGIVIQQAGCGTFTAAVTNNEIRQYNNFGISAQTGAGIAYSGNVNFTVTGNTVANPGNNSSIGAPFQGIALNNGVTAGPGGDTTTGDNYQTCWNVKANAANGSGRNGGHDFRTRSRMAGNVQLPGFVGDVNDDTALAAFIANQNDANANDPAANAPVPTSSVLSASTFSGGSACPLP